MKRDNFTLRLDLGHELAVDNFAGGGGASEAIRAALGRDPDIAINHDGEALCMHSANHPGTQHYREDVFLIHPGFVTKQQPIGLAWFSPTCTHFSKAKGGNLLDQKMRGLAWVTLKWAVMQMPRLMFLENVEEFQGWGPLDAAGKPIKAHKGRTFAAFVMALTTGIPEGHPDLAEIHETLGGDFPIKRLYTGLGYDVEWKTLRACDFGAPTIRKRLFMVMRRDRNPIVWPAPTHGQRDSAEVKAGKLKPFMSAADCIDWSIPCRSIFDRKKELAPATKRRIGKGFERYVKTQTTENRHALVAAHLVSIDNQSSGPGVTWDVQDPLRTVTTENRHALVTSNLLKLRGTSNAAAVDEPLGTASAGGTHHAEIRTTLSRTPESIERREQVRAFLREFCPSLKDAEFPELVTIHGEMFEVTDIGLRMLTPRELANAQGFRSDYILDPFYTSVNKRGKTVTKRLSGSAQVRMIGNSVSPPPATALILANTAHEREMARAA